MIIVDANLAILRDGNVDGTGVFLVLSIWMEFALISFAPRSAIWISSFFDSASIVTSKVPRFAVFVRNVDNLTVVVCGQF